MWNLQSTVFPSLAAAMAGAPDTLAVRNLSPTAKKNRKIFGLAPIQHHHLKETGGVGDRTRGSPPLDKAMSPLGLFPTTLLARQMLGVGSLSLHATLATSPGVYTPPWFANPSSPPPTPGPPSKRTGSDHVSSTSSARKTRKRVKSPVEIPPEPPLSPPTSGSSPQSNGSGQENKPTDKDKVFTCGICSRSFGYKHVLQNHERTHTGEKPFECRECHKRFTRDHHLKTHMRLHTGEKPYHCTHCDRQFVQVANLRRHLRVHTGERPYACEMCTSRFSDSNQLKAHLLIHKGEKPFHCNFCNGRFRRRHHLMHHKCPNRIPVHDVDSLEDEDSRETELEIDEDAESNPSSPDYPRLKSPVDKYILSINNNKKVRERKSRDIRRVVRVAETDTVLDLALPQLLPEQTEPEDLSMPKSKLRTQLTQNNNEVGRRNKFYTDGSPNEDNHGMASLYHPKFRHHVAMRNTN